MKFICEIETDNEAFEDTFELPRILYSLASKIQDMGVITSGASIRDVNGNLVGEWRIEE